MALVIQTEVTRKLPSVSYVENQPQRVKLPTDTALKRLNVRLSGWFSVTYVSGSPIADASGIFNRICPQVEVAVDGQQLIKSMQPFAYQQLQFFKQGILGEQRYSTASSAPTSKIGTTDGTLGAFPATTYFVVINECVTIDFENKWAYGFGSDLSLLNLKRSSNPELRFYFASFPNIQTAATSSVSVTYAANTLQFDITTIEAQDVGIDESFFILKEYTLSKQYSAQSSDATFDLNTGNLVQGLLFIVRNGDSAKTLSNVPLTRIQLRLNGVVTIKDTTFLELSSENRARRGMQAPTSGGVTRMDGCAYMGLMRNGDIRSCLNTSTEAGVKQLQLLLSTAASSGVDAATYTNPVEVVVVVQEILVPPQLVPGQRAA